MGARLRTAPALGVADLLRVIVVVGGEPWVSAGGQGSLPWGREFACVVRAIFGIQSRCVLGKPAIRRGRW